MPSDTKLKFNNIHKQLRSSFTVYADFESILKSCDVETSPVGVSSHTKLRTVPCQKHVPCSYAYKVVSDVPQYQPPLKQNISENAAAEFLNDLDEITNLIMTEYILKQKRKN